MREHTNELKAGVLIQFILTVSFILSYFHKYFTHEINKKRERESEENGKTATLETVQFYSCTFFFHSFLLYFKKCSYFSLILLFLQSLRIFLFLFGFSIFISPLPFFSIACYLSKQKKNHEKIHWKVSFLRFASCSFQHRFLVKYYT